MRCIQRGTGHNNVPVSSISVSPNIELWCPPVTVCPMDIHNIPSLLSTLQPGKYLYTNGHCIGDIRSCFVVQQNNLQNKMDYENKKGGQKIVYLFV